MPITAAVVNPIVATIDRSINASGLYSMKKSKSGAIKRDGIPDPLGDHGFSDSVYARSWDQPLMNGI